MNAEDLGTTGDGGGECVSPGSVRGVRLAAAVIVAFGLLVLWGSLTIPPGTGFVAVGPSVFPLAVSVGLLVTGVLFLVRATVWPDRWLLRKATEEDATTHWPTPALVVTALVVYAAALQPVGYLLATALFLPASARILGSRKPARDVAAGLLLATVLFFGFTEFLGIRLPSGLLDPIL